MPDPDAETVFIRSTPHADANPGTVLASKPPAGDAETVFASKPPTDDPADTTGLPASAGGRKAAHGPLDTGQQFGSRYHILRELGIGGMGAV